MIFLRILFPACFLRLAAFVNPFSLHKLAWTGLNKNPQMRDVGVITAVFPHASAMCFNRVCVCGGEVHTRILWCFVS